MQPNTSANAAAHDQGSTEEEREDADEEQHLTASYARQDTIVGNKSNAQSYSHVLGELSNHERSVEERLRTLAMCTCAIILTFASLYWLRTVLVPFVLAFSLQQMLVPIVEHLVRLKLCGCLHMPRFIAVLVAIVVAAAILGGLGLVVADSVRDFSARVPEYTRHVQSIITGVFSWMDRYGFDSSVRLTKLKELGEKLPLTTMLMSILENLVAALENLFLILLFTLYLLLGGTSSPHASADGAEEGGAEPDTLAAQVDAQIRRFIKGKVLLSLLVGVSTGALLRVLNVDLWLGFGVLAFWLNFIPNVGALIAVLAPMPLVVVSPSFGIGTMLLALLLPLTVHLLVANLIEPIVFGRAMELHPVTVLLSLMLWGTLWGVPGLILAVPLTAVLRIHLSHIDHPLPRLLLRLLDGSPRQHAAGRASAASRHSASRHAAPHRPASALGHHETDDDDELLPLHEPPPPMMAAGEQPHRHAP